MRAARGFTRRYLASARALCACLAGENAYGELLDDLLALALDG